MTERSLVFHFEEHQSQRLDHFLVDQLPEHSRSFLQNLIKKGLVTVDGRTATKTGLKLEAQHQVEVRIPPSEPTDLEPEDIPLDIVFENEDVILVNKSAGMVVHPAAGHNRGTLVHAILAHAPTIEGVGGVRRPGLVHRLDKDTSGLIILAKNDQAHRYLQKQFEQREVEKDYLALVDGAPPTPEGRIEAPIGRDPKDRKKMAVVTKDKGRMAVSEYFTIENFKDHTLLEVRIMTGRTHQIRVHMTFIKCPVVGDTVYGRKNPTLPVSRQFLHAAKLKISLPGEKVPRMFETSLPEELQTTLDVLSN